MAHSAINTVTKPNIKPQYMPFIQRMGLRSTLFKPSRNAENAIFCTFIFFLREELRTIKNKKQDNNAENNEATLMQSRQPACAIKWAIHKFPAIAPNIPTISTMAEIGR